MLTTSSSHYLLAASGVSTGSALRDLKSFNAQAGIVGPPAEVLDTDLAGWLAKQQAKTTLEMIEEGLERSKRDFDAFIERTVYMDWDDQRRRVYEHLGLANIGGDQDKEDGKDSTNMAGGAFGRSSRRGRAVGSNVFSKSNASFGASGMSMSVIGSASTRGFGRGNVFADSKDNATANGVQSSGDEYFMRDKQDKLAEKVKQVNLARMQEAIYPVIREFAEVETQAGIDVSRKILLSGCS